MSGVVLSAEHISIRYAAKGQAEHLAVDDVSFDVADGERLVILGPSGCGKTTLLMSIAGFVTPSEGRVKVRGTQISGPGPDRAVVFQDFDQLFPWRTVAKNVAYAARLTLKLPKEKALERAHQYLNLVGIEEAADRFPHQLSGA